MSSPLGLEVAEPAGGHNQQVSMEVDCVVSDSDASTLGNSPVQNGSFSSSPLLMILTNSSADIESIAMNWFCKYINHAESSIMELSICILKACGLKAVNISETLLTTSSFNSSSTIDKNAVVLYPLSLKRSHIFHTNFPLFIEKILTSQNCRALFDESFMKALMDLIKKCMRCHWDSFRVVGSLAGLKLMEVIQSENDRISTYLRGVQGDPEVISEASEKKTELYMMWTFCLKFVFIPCTKDVLADVRTAAYKKLLHWAQMFPAIVLYEQISECIIRGFSDVNSENKLIALLSTYEILKKKLDVRRQQEFLNSILQDLFVFFNLGDNCVAIVLKLFLDGSKFLSLQLSDTQNEAIYIQVYHCKREIGVLAYQYINQTCFKNLVQTPTEILKSLVLFNSESYVKSEFVLMDSAFDTIKSIITWEHWYSAIASTAADDIEMMMTFLLAYVQIGVTGFVPKSRSQGSTSHTTKTAAMKIFQKEFHDFFSLCWMRLLSMDKVRLKSMALHKLISLFKYLLPTLTLDEVESILELIKNQYFVSENEFIMHECSQTLDALLTMYESNESILTVVKLSLGTITDSITCEFLELIKHPVLFGNPRLALNRMVHLVMHFEHPDPSIWDTAIHAISSSSSKFCDKDIIEMITILFQIIIRKTDEMVEMEKKSDSPQTIDVISRHKRLCMERVPYFLNVLISFLPDFYELKLSVKSFIVICRILERFDSDVEWDLSIELENESMGKLLDFVKYIHERPCSSTGLCCDVMNEACNLISSHIIPITYFSSLIEGIGKNSIHDDVVIALLKRKLIHPENIKSLAKIIFNALMITFSRVYKNIQSIEVALSSTVVLIKEILKPQSFNGSVLRALSIELHRLVIMASLSPNGCVHFIDTLIPLKGFLSKEDIAFVSSTVLSYKDFVIHPIIKRYIVVLNQP